MNISRLCPFWILLISCIGNGSGGTKKGNELDIKEFMKENGIKKTEKTIRDSLK